MAVSVRVGVGDRVGVGVSVKGRRIVGVGVRVAVLVRVAVGVLVGVRLGVGVEVPQGNTSLAPGVKEDWLVMITISRRAFGSLARKRRV